MALDMDEGLEEEELQEVKSEMILQHRLEQKLAKMESKYHFSILFSNHLYFNSLVPATKAQAASNVAKMDTSLANAQLVEVKRDLDTIMMLPITVVEVVIKDRDLMMRITRIMNGEINTN
jgi:hypothetical protein